MIIDVASLDCEGNDFEGEEPAEVLDLGDADEFRPLGTIKYKIRVSCAGDSVVASGVVSAELEVECARCTESFRLEVSDKEFAATREVANKNESIDLTPDIRESIILAFPTTPLCAPDCRGLCPQCGINLNKRECSCVIPNEDGWWSALNNLQLR
ncbi:MAG: DUF177 domain-containing protein [bacterium]